MLNYLKNNNTHTFNAKELWQIKDDQYIKNLVFADDYLKVSDQKSEAIYQSTLIKLNSFHELVISWNFKASNDAHIIIKVAVGNGISFSDFFTMGIYDNGLYKSLKNQENSSLKVNTDTLINKDLNNLYIKLQIIVKPYSSGISLNNLSVTYKPSTPFVFNRESLIEKVIDVPQINQKSVPVIGNSICSPTSLTMVLNYYGNNLNNVSVAKSVFDYEDNIYGNWSFNASYAYNYGLFSRVEYIDDFNKVVSYIKEGIPVIMSIGVAKIIDPNNKINYPFGHLVVLVGFKKIEGLWHVATNDPATDKDELVLKYYLLDSFLSAFKNYTYIIKENKF